MTPSQRHRSNRPNRPDQSVAFRLLRRRRQFPGLLLSSTFLVSRSYGILSYSQLTAGAAFYGNKKCEKQQLVDQVRRACLEKGFFQIINHGVSDELQTAIFEQSKNFFSLPAEEKVKLDKGQ